LGYISVWESLRISSTTFTQCALKSTEVAEITQKRPFMPLTIIQGHRFWYQSKAHVRLTTSD